MEYSSGLLYCPVSDLKIKAPVLNKFMCNLEIFAPRIARISSRLQLFSTFQVELPTDRCLTLIFWRKTHLGTRLSYMELQSCQAHSHLPQIITRIPPFSRQLWVGNAFCVDGFSLNAAVAVSHISNELATRNVDLSVSSMRVHGSLWEIEFE